MPRKRQPIRKGQIQNDLTRLWDEHFDRIWVLQNETCEHKEVHEFSREMISDAQAFTGRSVQNCKNCGKTIRWKAYCHDCTNRHRTTEINQDTAVLDPTRPHRGTICVTCLKDGPPPEFAELFDYKVYPPEHPIWENYDDNGDRIN